MIVGDLGLCALLIQRQAALVDLGASLIALGVLLQFLLLQTHQRVLLVASKLLLRLLHLLEELSDL